MCNIGKAISSIFGGGGSKDDGAAAAAAAVAAAQSNANAALLAQQQANDQAKAAADTASETARVASEDRMRKLIGAGSFGATFSKVASSGAGAGGPSLGFRTLFGA